MFAYNATPHSTTGFQPYQLMFRCRALAPCDGWLGLRNYDDEKSSSKVQWVDSQVDQLIATNWRAMKNIKATTLETKGFTEEKTSTFRWVILYYYETIPKGDVKSKTGINQSCLKSSIRVNDLTTSGSFP